ncbi:N-acetylglucosaminyldiphosphoundecaprenol N-acetyl-beta-D-mannosaminyltransferase TarA [Staphylococcus pseudoxylosus]|uniref:N-acetylglucosaminyldiphosphoundecaprenol N-acetyl-beta-D-mannosaminyltransferase n=1 Tax=Staphylococcus pseudoxylosus TaxID=2282419 RepID=A0AAQ0MG96_9STAP|nr:N-acetylglucosaminyldiphosphoundecaprenol N-acetyl-beta-D-mannosaminyltransferase TarA [Staphylococcus pseudoxylosus]PTI83814.1 N-acetylmannosaminyltransferase [Staphylococcus xylosus]MBM2657926.1 WecB/TagA/CpsF family glycosyltransferase [Staphylococcus pseudoxylosus]MCE5001390.1 WecB/TagA/CpsF family glycosyltransferase [Staphylococcus pseudoxylosus]MEB5782786.1 WecB/TagA/CpsF family glycosyltransferase [Staphylococcus pseudoxylosus]MEB6170739.1 WecB/TagA/CpsF family glycosyltransferase [
MTESNKTNKVNVLSVYFDNVTLEEMQGNIKQFFLTSSSRNLFIVTANPEIVDYATENENYRNLINRADYVVPDGTGVVKAARILNTPLKARVPGIELMEACLKIANANQQKVFLLGAENDVVKTAQHKLAEKYPNVIFDCHHGFFDLSDEMVLKQVTSFDPDYVFVGMGYPRQEQWIERHSDQFNQAVLMGVGGSIEVFSGAKKRAPMVFRKLNIEWIYRLLIDWKRIGRMKSIPKFLFKVAKVKFKK